MKRVLNRKCWIVAIMVIVGCAGGYRVDSSVNADGVIEDRMVGNEIGLEGEGEYSDYAIDGGSMNLSGVDEQCYLDAVRRVKPGSVPVYYLLFNYSGPRDLHIVNRKSLTLMIDKHSSVVLSGRGEVKREADEVNKTYVESFYYLIPAEVLVRLADAEEVEVVVAGRQFELKGYLLDRNLDAFQRFVKDYVEWAD